MPGIFQAWSYHSLITKRMKISCWCMHDDAASAGIEPAPGRQKNSVTEQKQNADCFRLTSCSTALLTDRVRTASVTQHTSVCQAMKSVPGR